MRVYLNSGELSLKAVQSRGLSEVFSRNGIILRFSSETLVFNFVRMSFSEVWMVELSPVKVNYSGFKVTEL